MPETYTPADVAALAATPAGLRELDAAAARERGWEPPTCMGICHALWHRGKETYLPPGWEGEDEPAPPPYASGKDWRLWGELADAVHAQWSTVTVGWDRGKPAVFQWANGDSQWIVGDTIGIALLKALAAAGRLKREDAT